MDDVVTVKKWNHVYPLEDIFEHNFIGINCLCNPYVEGKNNLIVHTAFDGRDLIEEIEGIQ